MELVEELALTEQDRAAGVTWQGKVKLGDQWQGESIQMYLMDYANLEEVIALLGVEKTAK